MKTTLVVGATGMIGAALETRLRAGGWAVAGTTRTSSSAHSLVLDLGAPPATWPRLPRVDVAYICAGCSGLAGCDRDPEGTRRVNVDGVVNIARRLHDAGARVVMLSSHHVFDGTEPLPPPSSRPNPLNAYGAQKADAEAALLAMDRGSVLRLTKVIGPLNSRLVTWRDALTCGHVVHAFDDLAVAPVPLRLVVDALVDIGTSGAMGIFQLSGPRDETYYSLALATAAHLGASSTLVQRTSAAGAGIPAAHRPRFARLAQALPTPVDPPKAADVVAMSLE